MRTDARTAPMTFTVMVGFTSVRPVRPDERIRKVVLSAADDVEARLLAAYVVMAARRDCVMVTSTRITDVII